VQTADQKIGTSGNAAGVAGGRTGPVFVLGCPRSGTTLLYHMLLSAGDFAVYRAESNVFNLLAPRFGGMRSAGDRTKLMKCWLKSKLFRVSGINGKQIEAKIVSECRGAGDFLRLVMEEVARVQGVPRWADCTPEHLLYIGEIKRQIPDARFIHIIRDGRDVALSYAKQGWSRPLPWDKGEHLAVAGLYWEWLVRQGRAQGTRLGADYVEVRFEELVTEPRQTLLRLSEFVEHDLNYDRIQRAGIGSVGQPNSSFGDESYFNPVARWKTKMSRDQASHFEALLGDFLQELKYPVASENKSSLHAARLRSTYFAMFATKRWIRDNTPMSRLVRLDRIEIDPDGPAAVMRSGGGGNRVSFPLP
jgi:hypothetical protein